MGNRKLALITVLLTVLEICLQYRWGFCDLVLMRESDKFEYIAQPNQSRSRFGKRIYYNEYSMRSNNLQSSDSIRILGFGDSVLNGGMQTGQDSLATSIIEQTLGRQYRRRNIRCLNISCENWSPDNCFAYVEEYGDFDADMIFLLAGSHDAYDSMDFRKTLDIHPGFPSKQSLSAIYEMGEYLVSRFFSGKQKVSEHTAVKNSSTFNSGFQSFHLYTQKKDIPLLVYLHPDREEVINGRYDERGEEIIRFCYDNGIHLIEGLKHEDLSCFEDAIHFNEHGQRVLANVLLPEIKKLLGIEK
jgi:hypothetical protein